MKKLEYTIRINGCVALLIASITFFSAWVDAGLFGRFSASTWSIIWGPTIPHIIFWLVVAFSGFARYRLSLLLTFGIFVFMPHSYISPIYTNLVVNFDNAFRLDGLDATLLALSFVSGMIISLIGLGFWFNDNRPLFNRLFSAFK